MDREQIIELANIYAQGSTQACVVAKICDEVLDKSGRLLGEVRKVARLKMYGIK